MRIAPLLRLKLAVAQHQRLRKRQRGVAKVHPVQEGAVGGIVEADDQRRRAVFGAEIMTDGGGLGHPGVTVDQIRNGAERIEREIILGKHPRRERQHLELIRPSYFLQHPQRPERTSGVAVVERDHVVRLPLSSW